MIWALTEKEYRQPNKNDISMEFIHAFLRSFYIFGTSKIQLDIRRMAYKAVNIYCLMK